VIQRATALSDLSLSEVGSGHSGPACHGEHVSDRYGHVRDGVSRAVSSLKAIGWIVVFREVPAREWACIVRMTVATSHLPRLGPIVRCGHPAGREGHAAWPLGIWIVFFPARRPAPSLTDLHWRTWTSPRVAEVSSRGRRGGVPGRMRRRECRRHRRVGNCLRAADPPVWLQPARTRTPSERERERGRRCVVSGRGRCTGVLKD
jgi:hypothetical protein